MMPGSSPSASIRAKQVVRLVEQLDAQVVNLTLSYRHFLAIGGMALAFGFASGFRLNIAAILVISIAAGLISFATTLGFGLPFGMGFIMAVVTVVSLQTGYFLGILIRPRPREASSQESISAQKSNAP
jgi:hypothetical protein